MSPSNAIHAWKNRRELQCKLEVPPPQSSSGRRALLQQVPQPPWASVASAISRCRGAQGQALLQPLDKGFDGRDTVGLGRLQLSVFAHVLEEMGRDRHNLQPLKPQTGSSSPLITGSGGGRGVCRTLGLHACCRSLSSGGPVHPREAAAWDSHNAPDRRL